VAIFFPRFSLFANHRPPFLKIPARENLAVDKTVSPSCQSLGSDGGPVGAVASTVLGLAFLAAALTSSRVPSNLVY